MGSAERNWKFVSPEKFADRSKINDEFMEISIAMRLSHLGRFRDGLSTFARFHSHFCSAKIAKAKAECPKVFGWETGGCFEPDWRLSAIFLFKMKKVWTKPNILMNH